MAGERHISDKSENLALRLPTRVPGMVSGVSRVAYFETGLEVLSDVGYGGLKLAEVCNRLGVTTGSFYHYFSSWPAYTRDLVSYWVQDRTVRLIGAIREVS